MVGTVPNYLPLEPLKRYHARAIPFQALELPLLTSDDVRRPRKRDELTQSPTTFSFATNSMRIAGTALPKASVHVFWLQT